MNEIQGNYINAFFDSLERKSYKLNETWLIN